MSVARLEWAYLGFYGPQSGIVFEYEPEMSDYTNNEKEMFDLLILYKCHSPHALNRFDIATHKNIDIGFAEIEDYFTAVYEFVGGSFTGYLGNLFFAVDRIAGKDRWTISMHVHDKELSVVVKGTLEQIVNALIKVHLDTKEEKYE